MQPNSPAQSEPGRPADQALTALAELFARAGWKVDDPPSPGGDPRPDLLVRGKKARYAVEMKVSSEGRADRLVPLWAQAYLQALRATPPGWHPLAIVEAPAISDRVLGQIVDFARQHAPDAAIGVMDRQGRRHFVGEALESLNAAPATAQPHPRSNRANLFSDINQWLLKVLLASDLAPAHTGAPRGEYGNATELARAGKVSVMSAFRLIETLRADGHLDEDARVLRVVRRRALLERWRAWSASRMPRELPAVFVLPGDQREDLHAVLSQREIGACLALFAAAAAQGLGFVKGVPPHVYFPKLTPTAVSNLPGITLAALGEAPHLLLREAPSLHAVFRAAVPTDDGLATDVLQTWLDVSAHPTRGREQADVIERRALRRLLDEE
jgi:hypothetical protein